MAHPEFEPSSHEGSSLQNIKELKRNHFIKDGSPLWWSINHTPDPREYLPFKEFRNRLAHLGECRTTRTDFYLLGDKHPVQRDVYLYPEPRVPITVLDLEVLGQKLPFLVTARPYHEKELFYRPFSAFLHHHPSIKKLRDYVQSGGVIDLPDHFYPHIRGLYAGRRESHFFWYPLRINSWWREFGQHIDEALKKKGLSFIELYDPPFAEDRTYSDVWAELLEKKTLVDQKKPTWVDFPYIEVSAEEFLEDYQKTDQDLLVYYPVRLPQIETTLPLIMATRTHNESRQRNPVVLGIYAENGEIGRCRRGGILRIKDRQAAESISQSISRDFGIPVDAVLFTPQKGRPKYERVSSKTG